MVEHVKDKGWRARASWYDATGQRHQKQKQWFERKRDAQEWERRFLEEHGDLQPDADKLTVSKWLAKYLSLQESILAYNTICGYRANCASICAYIGNVELSRLRKIDIELMLSQMSQETVRSGKPIRLATIQYRFRTLRAALNCAVDNQYIKRNPCTGVRMPVMDGSFSPQVLSPEQGSAVLSALREQDGQLYLMVLLSIVYGLRRGEALGVRWCDVDENALRIRGQIAETADGFQYKAALKASSCTAHLR